MNRNRVLASTLMLAAFAPVKPASATQVAIKGENVELSLSLKPEECLPTGELRQKFDRVASAMDRTDLEVILILNCKNGKPVIPDF